MLIQIYNRAISNPVVIVIKVGSPHVDFEIFNWLQGVSLDVLMLDDVKSSSSIHFLSYVTRRNIFVFRNAIWTQDLHHGAIEKAVVLKSTGNVIKVLLLDSIFISTHIVVAA